MLKQLCHRQQRRRNSSSNNNNNGKPPEVAPKPKLRHHLAVIPCHFHAGSPNLKLAKSTPALTETSDCSSPNRNWKDNLESSLALDNVSSVSSTHEGHVFTGTVAGTSNVTTTRESKIIPEAAEESSISPRPSSLKLMSQSGSSGSSSSQNSASSVGHIHNNSDSGLSSLSGRTSTLSPVSTLSSASSESSRISLKKAKPNSNSSSNNSPPESLKEEGDREEDEEEIREDSNNSSENETSKKSSGVQQKFPEEILCEELSKELFAQGAIEERIHNLFGRSINTRYYYLIVFYLEFIHVRYVVSTLEMEVARVLSRTFPKYQLVACKVLVGFEYKRLTKYCCSPVFLSWSL